MTRTAAILGLLYAASAAPAGIYPPLPEASVPVSPEGAAQPLTPTNFALAYDARVVARNPDLLGDWRKAALERVASRLPKAAALPPDEFLALTGDLLRLGQEERALALLVPRSRGRTPDFRQMANLVQAYALGYDWDSALRAYEEFLLDAEPPRAPPDEAWRAGIDKKYTERWLRYHRKHARDKTDAATLPPIPLFGDGPLPPDAVAVAQQMTLDAPNDVFLLWALAETTAKAGDYRAAAKHFDRCTDRGLTQPRALLARRAEVHDIVDKLPKVVDVPLAPETTTPPPEAKPKGLFDLISPTKFYALGGAFVLVAVVLLMLQLRKVRRMRRRRIV